MLFVLFFAILSTVDSCLPTQNIVTTTTTTTTADPFPCNVCSKIYDTTCQGFGVPSTTNWCTEADGVPITYNLGVVSEVSGWGVTCYTWVTCPAGTEGRFFFTGSPGYYSGDPGPVLAFCAESGMDVGVWQYYYTEPYPDLMNIKCQSV